MQPQLDKRGVGYHLYHANSRENIFYIKERFGGLKL